MMPVDRSFLLRADEGAGPRVGMLLVHGLGGTPVEMKSLARSLRDAGTTVLACQLAGHCGTADDLRATRWEDWHASVEDGLARLEAECDIVVVGGLSMGGLLAARLAWAHPARVAGLVMLAPTLWYDGWSIPWYSFLLKLLIDTPVGQRFEFAERPPYGVKDERIRRLVLAAMQRGDSGNAGLLATPSQVIRQMWSLAALVKRILPAIRQPALLVHARQDDIAGLSNTLHLQRHLGGRVDVLVLEDSYHLVTVDRQRGLVSRRVAGFLEGLRDEAARPQPALVA
ncbi:carboxylesterase [Humitalea rosea]|uniref:Carboxylesterase n=1 Tax=Humitalea rosea TaxID=990373 RepID=A0A2W7INV6_9PROT|nr:alpha/beta fold hydrolase [Humitalea rosea]PZW49199.1 carboxylesterase [Humitalea rosea]